MTVKKERHSKCWSYPYRSQSFVSHIKEYNGQNSIISDTKLSLQVLILSSYMHLCVYVWFFSHRLSELVFEPGTNYNKIKLVRVWLLLCFIIQVTVQHPLSMIWEMFLNIHIQDEGNWMNFHESFFFEYSLAAFRHFIFLLRNQMERGLPQKQGIFYPLFIWQALDLAALVFELNTFLYNGVWLWMETDGINWMCKTEEMKTSGLKEEVEP